ncbi:MAG: RNA-binding protein [Proteobacteria bacterium]|nr:RNA-binding protein [Pseudomonadota bacterium]
MTTHNMKLYKTSFGTISSGTQTIELRLYDEKRRLIHPGDQIVFTYESRTIRVKVLGLSISDNFANLAKMISVHDAGWANANEMVSGLRKNYYSNADQKKYGVVGIHIARIK